MSTYAVYVWACDRCATITTDPNAPDCGTPGCDGFLVPDPKWAAHAEFLAGVKFAAPYPDDLVRPKRNKCSRCHRPGNLVAVHIDGREYLMHKQCRHRSFRATHLGYVAPGTQVLT